MYVVDVCRMVKRRLKDADLPGVLSPHSFQVTTITDLLEQGVPLEDVQRLAGHADLDADVAESLRDEALRRCDDVREVGAIGMSVAVRGFAALPAPSWYTGMPACRPLMSHRAWSTPLMALFSTGPFFQYELS